MKKNKKIAILGYGVEGKELYSYFERKNEYEIHVFDEAEKDPEIDKDFFHKGFVLNEDFDIAYKSPGVPLEKVVIKNPNLKISSITDLVFSNLKSRVIGITGTKGKSTVSSLVYHVLSSMGFDVLLLGNIGEVNLDILDNDTENKIYVYETSSFQCEFINYSPHIAIITNIHPCHLDRHKTFDDYKNAKLNITRFQKESDFLITSLSDINTRANSIIIDEEMGNIKEIIGNNKEISQLIKEKDDFDLIKHPFETSLKGQHNQVNILMAYLVLRILSLSDKDIRNNVKSFKALKYRMEKIAEVDSISFYDDSLATVPEATESSIKALSPVDTIILGGVDVGLSFENFAKFLAKTKIRNFIIFPDTGKEMVKYIKDKNIFEVNNMKDAVSLAKKYTKGVCLLSNASPSQNLFKNYKDKSDQYRYWVNKK